MLKTALTTTFGALLREYRVRNGWTQEHLGRHLGLSGNRYVSNLEKGKHLPSTEKLAVMCEVLGLSDKETAVLTRAANETAGPVCWAAKMGAIDYAHARWRYEENNANGQADIALGFAKAAIELAKGSAQRAEAQLMAGICFMNLERFEIAEHYQRKAYAEAADTALRERTETNIAECLRRQGLIGPAKRMAKDIMSSSVGRNAAYSRVVYVRCLLDEGCAELSMMIELLQEAKSFYDRAGNGGMSSWVDIFICRVKTLMSASKSAAIADLRRIREASGPVEGPKDEANFLLAGTEILRATGDLEEGKPVLKLAEKRGYDMTRAIIERLMRIGPVVVLLSACLIGSASASGADKGNRFHERPSSEQETSDAIGSTSAQVPVQQPGTFSVRLDSLHA